MKRNYYRRAPSRKKRNRKGDLAIRRKNNCRCGRMAKSGYISLHLLYTGVDTINYKGGHYVVTPSTYNKCVLYRRRYDELTGDKSDENEEDYMKALRVVVRMTILT